MPALYRGLRSYQFGPKHLCLPRLLTAALNSCCRGPTKNDGGVAVLTRFALKRDSHPHGLGKGSPRVEERQSGSHLQRLNPCSLALTAWTTGLFSLVEFRAPPLSEKEQSRMPAVAMSADVCRTGGLPETVRHRENQSEADQPTSNAQAKEPAAKSL